MRSINLIQYKIFSADENPITVHDERKQIFPLQSKGKDFKVLLIKPANAIPTKQPREAFARSTLVYHPPQRQ